MGRGTKSPPQFGQTSPSTPSTHAAQNVHSKLQMRASLDSGGSGLLQCSQVGLSSSMFGMITLNRFAAVAVLTEEGDAARHAGGCGAGPGVVLGDGRDRT